MHHFEIIKQKLYSLTEKFDKSFLILVPANCELENDYNCCSSFTVSLVDKVTTGSIDFLSVITNVVLDMQQYLML